jgi:DNA-directed RNA polymerase
MDHICKLAGQCTKEKRFLKWTSPSGFPVENRYQEPNEITVTCLRGSVRVAQHLVADGVTDKIDEGKVRSAASPNFVHSLDAAHLIKVVNAAVNEGITNVLTVHDCFACLAPQAGRFLEIILAEMANLYENNDPLGELRSQNGIDPNLHPTPMLVSWEEDGEGNVQVLPFLLDKVKKSNGFG